MRCRLALLSVLALLGTVRAQTEPPDPLEKRVSLSLEGTLGEQLHLLREKTGFPFDLRVEPETSPAAFQKVRIALEDVPVRVALYWIAELHGCGSSFRNGRMVVNADLRGWRGDPVMRTYEVDGLVVDPGTPVPPRLGIGKELLPGLQVLKEPPKPPDEIIDVIPPGELLLDLIKGNVAPGTWEGDVSVIIDPTRKLLVHQTPEGHRELSWFLASLKAFPKTTVTVSLDVAEADASLAELLAPGAPAVLSPKATEDVVRRLHERQGRSIQVSGLAAGRFHSLLSEETAGVQGFLKGSPMVGKWLTEAAVLDVRPVPVDHGRAVFLDLRLALGHTRSFEPVKTRAGLLPLHERQLMELGTSLIVPVDGGVLLSLPARSPEDPRPRIALLRARAGKEPVQPPPPFLLSPPQAEPDGGIPEKLAAAGPRALDLQGAPIEEFAAWLREAAKVNVVVASDLAGERVTVKAAEMKLPALLTRALEPSGLTWTVYRGVLLLRRAASTSSSVRTCIVDLRAIVPGVGDFPARPDPSQPAAFEWTDEDLANLVKNYVDRDSWEEADGKSIQADQGLLVIRNEERVVKHALEFVDKRRAEAFALLSIRADTLLVPTASVDEILGAGGEGPAMADRDQAARLLKAGKVLERLGWSAVDRQRTSLTWDRSRDHLHSVDGDDPILRADVSPSTLDLGITLGKDGAPARVDLRYEDRRLLQLKEVKVTDDVAIQVPSGHAVAAKTTIDLPADRSAVFRWSAPAREGQPAESRLLVLSVTPQK